jgi:hypothetical protein
MSLIAINPVNGEKLKEYKEPAWEQVVHKIEQIYTAWQNWGKTSTIKNRVWKNSLLIL